MDMSTGDLIAAIFSIVLLDLVLSGDNAAVIGMAICRLPKSLRRKAAVLGAGMAIGLRILLTTFAVLLLQLPYVSAIGGVVLLFITYKLLKGGQETVKTYHPIHHFWQAIAIIVLADLSMAFDNVLGVAGAAHGQPLLVVFGLMLSIPILVLGASLISNLMNRWPIILWLGAAVLLHTSFEMIFADQSLPFFTRLGDFREWVAWMMTILILTYRYWKPNLKKGRL